MWPFTALDASEARNTAGPSNSSGSNQRPAGSLCTDKAIEWDDGYHLPDAHEEVLSVELRYNQDPDRCTGYCTHHTQSRCYVSTSSIHPWFSVCRNGFTTQLAHHRTDVDNLTMTLPIIPGITALDTMNGAVRSCRSPA